MSRHAPVKILLRIPSTELHQRLRKASEDTGVSINSLIIELIDEFTAEREEMTRLMFSVLDDEPPLA